MAILIRAARVLVESSAELLKDGAVLVEGDRILKAGPYDILSHDLAPEVTIKDLGDVTLMPGLFDCHVHITADPDPNSKNKLLGTAGSTALTDEELIVVMTSNASKLLDAGITTVRDLGSRGVLGAYLRDHIASGEIMGPRMQVAHAPITVPGGHCFRLGGEAQGVDEVQAMVRKRAGEGADLIKVMTTGGFMTAGTHPATARYTLEELKAIKAEAMKFGMPVTTHATGTEGIERAVDAKFDSIEHCAWLSGDRTKFDERIAKKMLDYDIAVCPTMNTACVEHNYFCPWDSRKAIVSNLTALRDVGVKIIVGTDAGIPLCFFERYADGLTVLADAGYTTREIIAAATDVAASVCGLSKETGKIAPGLAADMAAFEGNPLEDVQAFFEPRFVMARGREHKLTPIAKLGEGAGAEAAATVARLRKGAGMTAELPE